MLNECEALLNQEALPEPHGLPQLTLQIDMRRVKPLARRALHELAKTQEAAKEALLRQWLAPEGLILASGERYLYQRIRFGPQWVKNQHRKVIELRPDALPFHWFVRWLVQRAHHHIEDILLDRALGGERSDPLETSYKRLDDVIAQRMKMKKPLSEGFFIPSPKARLEAQMLIAALGSVASPRERELLSLLDAGASREEAAALLGISRKTVDVHCSNLRQKLRAL
jgi:Bacterial regulatory proteins, luxR family